ncbi:MAG: lysophospholipid acyltransferase family protein [Myxococcaceae bacterium]
MRHLFSVFLWSWIVLWGLILCVVGMVLFIPFNPWVDPKRTVWDVMAMLWGKGVLFVLPFIDLELVGVERLKGGGPYLICPNHSSIADTVVLLGMLPLYFKFIGRGAIFSIPPLSIQARMAGYINASAGEEGGAERVMAETTGWFKRGCSVLVFPEGTRSKDGKVARFRKGPLMLAQQAGAKILPVAVSGNHYIIAKGSFSYRFYGKVRVEILEPIESTGELKDLAAKTRDAVRAALVPGLVWQEEGEDPATVTTGAPRASPTAGL